MARFVSLPRLLTMACACPTDLEEEACQRPPVEGPAFRKRPAPRGARSQSLTQFFPQVLFLTPGKQREIKRNLATFSGFVYTDKETREKKEERVRCHRRAARRKSAR